MSISSVSSSAGTTYSSSANSDKIAQLEKEKTKLEKELKEVNKGTGDAKTKQQKVSQLQNQIQQLQAQIQQLKSEKSDQTKSSMQQGSASSNGSHKAKTRGVAKENNEDFSSNIIDIQI
ncbi:MAG: hypothetical protein APF77_13045 [Clostridia bacterium BRH_c25]|nr:MAG: hypothetical protein APF77_13045 [Clostridia bacterium BRH_c25]